VLIAQSLHILIMQWPFMQRILGVAPVSLSAWFSLLGLAGFLLVAMEVFKYLRRRSMPG
jgi:hypothetical protein